MQVEHIGYVVKNINKSVVEFEKLGYVKSSVLYEDVKRKIKVLFMKNGSLKIELVEPMDETSDAYTYMKKLRNAPYHICYLVDDIDRSIEELNSDGYLIVKEKDYATAFEGRKVCFLYKEGIGLIEIVEK